MQRGVFAKKHRVSRLSTLTDATALSDREPGKEDGNVLDAAQEKRWKEYSLTENIKMGAQTLLIWTAILIITRGVSYGHRSTCHVSKWSDQSQLIVRIIEFSFLSISCIPLTLCLTRPNISIYLPVVCFHFLYLLLFNLPPLGLSCQELTDLVWSTAQQGCADASEDSERYKDAAKHLDCSLQGHTSLHMCMTWLIIMPRVIPRKWLHHGLTWSFIFVLYLGATIWYIPSAKEGDDSEFVAKCWSQKGRCVLGSPYFSDWEILCSVLLLSATNVLGLTKKMYLEKSQKNKFIYDVKMRGASEKMFDILHYMVPVHVIGKMLKNTGEVIADPIDTVSILFIMICDFEQYTRSKTPEQLLAFLNEQFTNMDRICAEQEVTKIETVGEEYVAAVGVIPSDVKLSEEKKGHEIVLARLVNAAFEILMCQEGGVQFKMGMHTGPVVAGVIGHKLPRFRLFGDTINTSARMMQKSLPGELQFGKSTRDELPDGSTARPDGSTVPIVHIIPRPGGPVEMKGKGPVDTWLLDRPATEEQHKKSGRANGVCFENDVVAPLRERAGTTDSARLTMTKRKTVMSTLIVNHADVLEEANNLVLAENEARRPRTSSRLSGRPATASDMRPSMVELTTVSKEQGSRNMKAPLLDSAEQPASASQPERTSERTSGRTMAKGIRNPSRPRATTAARGRLPTMALSNSRSVASSRPRAMSEDEEEPPKEETQRKEQFEKVLEEISSSEMHERTRSRWLTFGIDKEGFTKEMEQKWYQWYHESTICKKLVGRLDKQALGMSILMALETIYMVTSSRADEEYHPSDDRKPGTGYFGPSGVTIRFPVFLGCNSIAFLIIMSWRFAAGSSDWMESAPKAVQIRILGSYMVIAWLMFLTYDTMTQSEDIRVDTMDPPDAKRAILGMTKGDALHWEALHMEPDYYSDFGRETSFASLAFVPLYFVVISFFQLLFLPSCCFIWLSIGLMAIVQHAPGFSSMYFSTFGTALFIINSIMNAYLAHEAEQTSRARFKAKHTMDCTCKRIETILNTLMPPNVVEDIRAMAGNAIPPSHKYDRATIAQSDLCGFTKLAATRRPEEVVTFMGELFGLFDELTDKYDIYKVETIGDAYIAGQADYPLTEKNKPISVVLFGLDMVRKTHEWARGMGENVSCRVGVITGECIGGIVGTEMQRYHLFGDLMTGLEVLESTAPEGKVQVSVSCKEACERQMSAEALPMEAMMFEPMVGDSLKTSKGEIHHFEEIGGRSFTVRSYAQLRSLITT